MESINKTTKPRQFEIIVDFMKKHSQLAKGHLKTHNARQTANVLWNSLTEELNASGPPIRDTAGWKKVWADFKLHTKQKLRKNRLNIGGTGGGRSKYCPLTPLEEQVIELLNMEESVNGLGGALSFGATTASPPEKTEVKKQFIELPPDELVEEAMEDVSSQDKGRKRKRSQETTFDRDNLLQKQVENQITFQKECLNSLNKINASLQSLSEQQKKDLELREKSFDLAKKKFEFEKENVIEKRNFMKQKLELKRKLYELKKKTLN